MNRFGNILTAIIISSFLALNFQLLFSDKSVIHKSVYVNKFERMTANDFRKELPKEALITPSDIHTVYVGNEEEVESWLVSEGDHVSIGDELALLNTARTDDERELIETEYDALLQQQTEIKEMISNLSIAQSTSGTENSSTVDRQENVTEIDGETIIELDLRVDFSVDVTQEGSYTQAISAAEQQLSEITQDLTVLETQLAQNPSRPAIISPVEGVVSAVTRYGTQLAVDIFSSEKNILTFAIDDEWQMIEEGDNVLIQGKGLNGVENGAVLSVSKVPSTNNDTLEAYKILDSEKATNPLAYYEVKISTVSELSAMPYGNNINAVIITNEAKDAVFVNEKWIRRFEEESAISAIIDPKGRAKEVTITTPFMLQRRAVVTEGLIPGQIVIPMSIHLPSEESPKVFLPIPSYSPTTEEWKSVGWKKIIKNMILD